jgi:hypothetical protein
MSWFKMLPTCYVYKNLNQSITLWLSHNSHIGQTSLEELFAAQYRHRDRWERDVSQLWRSKHVYLFCTSLYVYQ